MALNSVIELMRDLKRPRSDMWEVAVWEDALSTDEREVYMTFQVHNEAIVVPESVDAVRSLTGLEKDWRVSVEKTNESLGILKSFLPKTIPEEAVYTERGKRLSRSEREHQREGFKGAEEPTGSVFSKEQRDYWLGK